MTRTRWALAALYGYGLLILILSSIPSDTLTNFSYIFGKDKWLHFSEYLGFGFLAWNVLYNMEFKKILTMSFILALLLFPVMDELYQFFIPGRIPDVLDLLADWSGCLVGVMARVSLHHVKIPVY